MTPASATSTSATCLKRSPLMPWLSDWLSGAAAPIATARSSSSRPMPVRLDGALVAVPARCPRRRPGSCSRRSSRSGRAARPRARPEPPRAPRSGRPDRSPPRARRSRGRPRSSGPASWMVGMTPGTRSDAQAAASRGTANTGEGGADTRTAVPGARPALSAADICATMSSPSPSSTWARASEPRKLTARTWAVAPSSGAEPNRLGPDQRGDVARSGRSLEQRHLRADHANRAALRDAIDAVREPHEFGHEARPRALVQLDGGASCSSRPADMTPTRSPNASASSWSWVTKRVVVPIMI